MKNTKRKIWVYSLSILGVFLMFATGCKNNAIVILPLLSTTSVSVITATSAISGGKITSDGGASVTVRGVCWSTSQTPTTANSKTTNGTGTGAFTSSITALTASTTYYVRAYATNSAGTAYGDQLNFTTSGSTGIPTLATTAITLITTTTATSGGNITSDGGTTITARGVCWSTSANPTIALSTKTTDGTGTGTFTSSITGLTPGATYYIRAYAINSQGPAYGTQVSFTTSSGLDISSLPSLTLPPGSVTSNIAGFLELTLTEAQNRLSKLDISSGGQINTEDLRSKLESMRILFGQLKNKIRESMANQSHAETVGEINGVSVSLNQENLRIADQWMVAVINGILAEMQKAPSLPKQANRLMISNFQATGCTDDPALCELLQTFKMVSNSELVTSQQYYQSVVPLARDKLVDLSSKFGAAAAVIGAAIATMGGSIPLNAIALLTTAPLISFTAQFGMDATMFSVNSNDKEAAKRVLDDFDDGMKSVLTGAISPIISAISEKAGICFDLYIGLEPLFEDKLTVFLAQARTFIEVKPPSTAGTYTGPFNGTSTITIDCAQANAVISLTIKIAVSGSGTLIDPFSGSITIEGSGVSSIVYCNCGVNYTCIGGITAINGTGIVSGSQGKVEASASSAFTASFTGGTFSGNTLIGTFTFNIQGLDFPIVKTITLTK